MTWTEDTNLSTAAVDSETNDLPFGKKRPWLWRAVGTAVIIVIIYLTRSLWLPMPGQLLVNEKPLSKADAIVVLMGSTIDRTTHAYELYNRGVAPLIVFAKNESEELVNAGFKLNDAEATFAMLAKFGVEPPAIDYMASTANTSTREEAEVILAHLAKTLSPTATLVIVTSWYHSSRAMWVFEKFNNYGFTLISSPAYGSNSDPASWWQNERSFLFVFNEYLKWVYYLFN